MEKTKDNLMKDGLASASSISVFISYAHADKKLRDELVKHLSSLRQQGLISVWYDQQIIAGTKWEQAIESHLDSASVILLLISPEFLASDYCSSIEMERALARHETGK